MWVKDCRLGFKIECFKYTVYTIWSVVQCVDKILRDPKIAHCLSPDPKQLTLVLFSGCIYLEDPPPSNSGIIRI